MNFGNESYENLTPHTKIKNMRNRMFISEFISLQVSPSDRASELGFGLRKSPFLKSAPSHGAASFVKENFARGGPKKCQEAREEGREEEGDPNEHKQTDIAPEVCLGDGVMQTSLLCHAWRHSS